MMETYSNLLIAVTLLFVAFLVWMAYTIWQSRRIGVALPVVCAGNPTDDADTEVKTVSLDNFALVDENGKELDLENTYEAFVVSGESMSLAEIHEGDLVLSKKGMRFGRDIQFPDIFVLDREHPKDKEPKVKLRRVWAVCKLNASNDAMKESLQQIFSMKDFKVLQNDSCYPGDDSMVDQFINYRLPLYRKEHPGCERAGSPNFFAVISTTLRTNKHEIGFSIHPVKAIRGRVDYVFDNPC